ncbi:hypothetical protein BD626DRAFT_8598 [Schizophyllum amplum]|uniref:Uncharacterized protein n=1 Tax=Schizophyllum amplum TaxID=97359 RepID=A0A550CWS0_9AGAR|nr:hypothetical protein BD626DRAFT_8598 [Auriculariopsis ampla]
MTTCESSKPSGAAHRPAISPRYIHTPLTRPHARTLETSDDPGQAAPWARTESRRANERLRTSKRWASGSRVLTGTRGPWALMAGTP